MVLFLGFHLCPRRKNKSSLSGNYEKTNGIGKRLNGFEYYYEVARSLNNSTEIVAHKFLTGLIELNCAQALLNAVQNWQNLKEQRNSKVS